jgi:3-hydroxybutyryl-CoA dehydrogenase
MTVVRATDIQRVAVIGTGTMGCGIAQVAGMAGYQVRLFDEKPDLAEAAVDRVRRMLDKSAAGGTMTQEEAREAKSRLEASRTLEEAAARADLVVEAIPEDLSLKETLFAKLGGICRASALLASNTSSLSLTRIARAVSHPERVLGLHFFNPPHRMKLVEVVRGGETSDAALESALGAVRRMGKEAIVVRDSPGFATSRLGVALGLEAMRMLEEGVARPEDIDKAMELGYGHPMGPLRVSDLVGLDVRLSIAQTLHSELGAAHFAPPRILVDKVREGKLGKKSGEGFYRWDSEG